MTIDVGAEGGNVTGGELIASLALITWAIDVAVG